MLVMSTTKRPAHPVGEFIRAQQSVELHDLALAMNPFRLDGVQPRTLLREQATDDPHPTAALLYFSVVFAEPSPHLPGDVPACVVPDEKQGLLAKSFEPLAAPREKPRAYGTDGPAVDEPYPHVVEPWKVEAVAGYGLRVGVVFGDRLLDHARGLALLGEGAQSGQRHPAPPAFVQKADGPQGVGVGCLHQSVAPPFFRSYKGSGEVIQRLARCQRMPRRREIFTRTASPETLFSVRPSSKAASAAISRVHRLVSYPNSLGERWSIPRSRSAEFASKARMALRTVCEAHPRLSAILGGELPRALASSIWQRRRTKVSLECSPASRLSRSFADNSRTNIGGFMKGTIAHHTQPSLRMH